LGGHAEGRGEIGEAGRKRLVVARTAKSPFNCVKKLAAVSYCDAAPPAASCSWRRNESTTRWMLPISTPINWPPTANVCSFTTRRA